MSIINTKAMSPQSKEGGDQEVVILDDDEKATNGVDLKMTDDDNDSETQEVDADNNAAATLDKTSYYTSEPKRSSFLKYPLTFSQRIREYRHNRCIMAPLAYIVIIALTIVPDDMTFTTSIYYGNLLLAILIHTIPSVSGFICLY